MGAGCLIPSHAASSQPWLTLAQLRLWLGLLPRWDRSGGNLLWEGGSVHFIPAQQAGCPQGRVGARARGSAQLGSGSWGEHCPSSALAASAPLFTMLHPIGLAQPSAAGGSSRASTGGSNWGWTAGCREGRSSTVSLHTAAPSLGSCQPFQPWGSTAPV